jgi:hypothetical protein
MDVILTALVFVAIVFVVMHWQDWLMHDIGDYGRADVSHLSRPEQIILDENRIKGVSKSSERVRLEILLFNHPEIETELMGDINTLNQDEIKNELERLSQLVRNKDQYIEPRQVAANGTLRPRKATLPQSGKKDLNLEIK